MSDVLFTIHGRKTAFPFRCRNRKIYAVSSLVLNLFASQMGEFFLPHPVLLTYLLTYLLHGAQSFSRS